MIIQICKDGFRVEGSGNTNFQKMIYPIYAVRGI